MKRRRQKQEQHTQKKCDNKISQYGSIIIAEEHDITSANTFPADDEKEEFCVVIIQGNGNLVIGLASIDAFCLYLIVFCLLPPWMILGWTIPEYFYDTTY